MGDAFDPEWAPQKTEAAREMQLLIGLLMIAKRCTAYAVVGYHVMSGTELV